MGPPVCSAGDERHNSPSSADTLTVTIDKGEDRPTWIVGPGRSGQNDTVPMFCAMGRDRANGHPPLKKSCNHGNRQLQKGLEWIGIRFDGDESLQSNLNSGSLQTGYKAQQLDSRLLGKCIIDNENSLFRRGWHRLYLPSCLWLHTNSTFTFSQPFYSYESPSSSSSMSISSVWKFSSFISL